MFIKPVRELSGRGHLTGQDDFFALVLFFCPLKPLPRLYISETASFSRAVRYLKPSNVNFSGNIEPIISFFFIMSPSKYNFSRLSSVAVPVLSSPSISTKFWLGSAIYAKSLFIFSVYSAFIYAKLCLSARFSVQLLGGGRINDC